MKLARFTTGGLPIAASRPIALKRGWVRYHGRACDKGHTIRIVKSKHCAICRDDKRKVRRKKPDYRNVENTRNKARRVQLRNQLIEMYGGQCACPGGCNVVQKEFLSIDHIGGGGKDHRASVSGGLSYYLSIIRHPVPNTKFRLLCHNCNQAIGLYGTCPHERKMVCE